MPQLHFPIMMLLEVKGGLRKVCTSLRMNHNATNKSRSDMSGSRAETYSKRCPSPSTDGSQAENAPPSSPGGPGFPLRKGRPCFRPAHISFHLFTSGAPLQVPSFSCRVEFCPQAGLGPPFPRQNQKVFPALLLAYP